MYDKILIYERNLGEKERSVMSKSENKMSSKEKKIWAAVIVVLLVVCLIGVIGWFWMYRQGIVIPFWRFIIHPTPVMPIRTIL